MMEYFIVELQGKGKVQHGSTFDHTEANEKAASIRQRTGNPVTVDAEFVSSNQIEGDYIGFFQYPLTAEEVFRQAHGDDADYDSMPSEIRGIYEACVTAGNKAIARILRFTDNSEGLES